MRSVRRVTEWIQNAACIFSRSRWLAWLMGLPKQGAKTPTRRLILIQVDALSKRQLERALQAGRMPFLSSLLQRQHYQLHRHYSGMPCCTPAVQAELFYGIPTSIPSFNYFDWTAGRRFVLSKPDDARAVEDRLRDHPDSVPLLRGGSCYSNIFTGGSDEPHFCIASLGFAPIFARWKTLGFTLALMLHFGALCRAVVLLCIEAVIALVDFFRGISRGHHAGKESLLMLSRVGMCILLRDILVIGTRIDIVRNLPIIQLNFMGYHEQSHRRGSTSEFAHWTLKGIDRSIRRIWKTAHKAGADYDVWIYSDHGQIDTMPFMLTCKMTLAEAVAEALAADVAGYRPNSRNGVSTFLERLGASSRRDNGGRNGAGGADLPIVTSHSPMGHIYFNEELSFDELCRKARTLVASTPIPVVLVPKEQEGAVAFSQDRTWTLPTDIEDFLQIDDGENPDLRRDFDVLCHHPDAGDLIVCGARPGRGGTFTFATENGSHGGIEPEERSGFCMVPKGTFTLADDRPLRPLDLHRRANSLVHGIEAEGDSAVPPAREPATIRIMTYNVRNCRGMDGRISPVRIAKVIEQFAPDIVALQELDVGRERSRGLDQAERIAATLRMDHVFAPAMTFQEGHYGNAILSHHPMEQIKSDNLPTLPGGRELEPRSALWVELAVNGRVLQVVTVHLGLRRRERRLQIAALLGSDWLGSPACKEDVIVMGDFNFMPKSRLHARCTERFQDAAAKADTTIRTFWANLPLVRLDHIFVSNSLTVTQCRTGRSALCKVASDHRPLIADVALD